MNKLLIALSLILSGSFAMAEGTAPVAPASQETISKEKKEVRAERKKLRHMKHQLRKDEKAAKEASGGEAK